MLLFIVETYFFPKMLLRYLNEMSNVGFLLLCGKFLSVEMIWGKDILTHKIVAANNIYLLGIFIFSGSKKQISKTLKTLASLYASFSSELVSVLLEFLLKALDSSNVVDLPNDSQVCQDLQTLLDDWKLVIAKFSSKEPELILALLQRILDIVGTKEDTKYGMGKYPLYFALT